MNVHERALQSLRDANHLSDDEKQYCLDEMKAVALEIARDHPLLPQASARNQRRAEQRYLQSLFGNLHFSDTPKRPEQLDHMVLSPGAMRYLGLSPN